MSDDGTLARRWPFYSEKSAETVAKIVNSGAVYDSGENEWVENIETEFREKLAPGSNALFCGSGTAALYSAYFSLNLPRGAEVILPVNSFRATATPLLLLNLTPVFCDVCPKTGVIDFAHAETLITPRTAAIAVTHMWGHIVDLDMLRAFANKHKLSAVEDCSHAHGLQWKGQPVGSAGDVAAFSLGTKKIVSGGSGGMLVTGRRDVFERALVLGHPRSRALEALTDRQLIPYARSGLGANFRGNPMSAVLALDHLERLPDTLRIKNENLCSLIDSIREHLPFVEPLSWSENITRGTRYALKLTVPKEIGRGKLLTQLANAGVPVSYGSEPLHEQKQFIEPLLSSLALPENRHSNMSKFHGALELASTIFEVDTRALYDFSPATAALSEAFFSVGRQY